MYFVTTDEQHFWIFLAAFVVMTAILEAVYVVIFVVRYKLTQAGPSKGVSNNIRSSKTTKAKRSKQ